MFCLLNPKLIVKLKPAFCLGLLFDFCYTKQKSTDRQIKKNVISA